MTSAEKRMVFECVMKTTPIKSTWTVYSFGKWIQTHRSISALVFIVIVISAGNSAVLASRNTLPGDTLYPIKVNMVEPIRVAFAPTPRIKAEIQTELVQSRLQEAETLAARGQLNDGKEQSLNQRIDQQVSDLTANINEVKKTSPEKADDISTTLEASINAHTRILDVIAVNRGESHSNSKENGAINVDGAVTSAMVASSSMSESTQTSRTSLKLNKKSESKDESKNNKKYSKRKESVESLIQSTTADVAGATTTATSSLLQETIVNDARINLDHAQEKLQEAQNHNSNGNSSEAYSALIDSERATKEAALFIKATSRLEKEVKNEEINASSHGNNNVQGGQSGKVE